MLMKNTLKRRLWADFFDGQGIDYAFFSAANAAAIQQARRDAVMDQAALLQDKDAESGTALRDLPQSDTRGDAAQDTNDAYEDESDSAESDGDGSEQDSSEDGEQEGQRDLLPEEDATDLQNVRTKVLSVIELEQLFEKLAPDIASRPIRFIRLLCRS
jgi:large subunit GTPase 1